MTDLRSIICCLYSPQVIKDEKKTTKALPKQEPILSDELRDAVKEGDLPKIIRLTAGRRNINRRTRLRGWTPLHIASFHGYTKVVDYLIAERAEIDKYDHNQRTPLFVASHGGHLEIAKILVVKGASVHRETVIGRTPLFAACRYNRLELVAFLLEKKANANHRDNNGHTPLFIATHMGHMDIVKFLVNENVDKELEDIDKWTPFHAAMIYGRYEIGKYLAEIGVNTSSKTRGKYGALHLASQHGHSKNANFLIRRGADVNQETAKGVTPLMLAAGGGHFDCVQLLLDQDPDVRMKDKEGWTALHYAATSKDESIIYPLLCQEAVLKEKNKHGQLPLHIAIAAGNPEMARRILGGEMKSSPETTDYLDTADEDGLTPVHLATMRGFTSVIEILLDLGADANIQSNGGDTPLHFAIKLSRSQGKQVELTSSLKKIQRESGDKITPAQALVKFLVEKGSDITIADAKGFTAVQYTCDEVTRHMLLFSSHFKFEEDKVTNLTVHTRLKSSAVKEVGFEGASLHLDGYGITMSIKPGVVEPGSRREFSIEVMPERQNFDLLDDETVVSLGVQFRLPEEWEFSFQHPVIITVPHAANVCSETAVYTDVITRNIDNKQVQRIITYTTECCQVKEQSFELSVFAESESLKKEICMPVKIPDHATILRFMYTPYLPLKRISGEPIMLRVYFHADIPGMKNDMEEKEENTGYHQAHPSRIVQLNPKCDNVDLSCNGEKQTLKTETLFKRLAVKLDIQLPNESDLSERMIKMAVETDSVVQSTMSFMVVSEDTTTDTYAEYRSSSSEQMKEKQDSLLQTIAEQITIFQYYHLGAALGLAHSDLDRIQFQSSTAETSSPHDPRLAGTPNKRPTFKMISMWKQAHPINANYHLNEIWKSLNSNDVHEEAVEMEDITQTSDVVSERSKDSTTEDRLGTSESQYVQQERQSSKDIMRTGPTYRQEQSSYPQLVNTTQDSQQIDITIPPGDPCEKEHVNISTLHESPPELLLNDNEAIISVGLKMSPSGHTFSSPVKITVQHSAWFTKPQKAEVAFYTRQNGEVKFTRMASSDAWAPRCVLREHDLDFHVDHFSEWWIVSLITKFFVGKQLICTPYVNPQWTVLFIQFKESNGDAQADAITGYRAIFPSEQFFVKWHRGNLTVKYLEDEEQKASKVIKEQSLHYVSKRTVYIPTGLTNVNVHKKIGYNIKQGRDNEVEIRFNIGADVNARVDDKLLFDIAEEIETDDHLERLMNALQITQAARNRYHGLNRSEGRLTARGTRDMLHDWRTETTIAKQRQELKDALTKAKLLDLRDTFFPGETASADVETMGTVE